jgi:hypothetical protein
MSAYYYYDASSSCSNGARFTNCTFDSIKGTNEYAPAITIETDIPSVNVTGSFFVNISNDYEGNAGNCITYYMGSDYNGNYSFTENSFNNISGNNGAIYFILSFGSFNFSNNSFSNCISTYYGGVFIFYFLFLFIYLFLIN